MESFRHIFETSRSWSVAAVALVASAACSYGVSFRDCEVSCTTGCPAGFECSASEGLCRPTGGASVACSTILDDAAPDAPGQFRSCNGLAATCGSGANDNCCATATTIPGGMFFRSYDVATDGMYLNASYPATVSTFVLDKYEVTVGRYRQFVDAGRGTQQQPPMAGDGAHALIPGSGWDSAWNASLPTDTAALAASLACGSTYQTWTAAAASNENLPISCVTWYEAMAFCAWDGGFLPTETEWNYAASGGSEQRAYPWSVPAGSLAIDCAHANFNYNGTQCVMTLDHVGSESPMGDARWGQADMSGNLAEWTLDTAGAYTNPCDDCARLASNANRVDRGGDYQTIAASLRASFRDETVGPDWRGSIGLRCARTP
jgi:sulfatase modifying factor 1